MKLETFAECPLCKCPVRVVRRADGSADHHEALTPDDLATIPNPISPVLEQFLRAQRKGKRTVAIAGSAWTSRSWAPYDDPDVEVWCFNEMHGQLGVGKATRWFQLHPKWNWAANDRYGHNDWLEQDRNYPIYMQKVFDDVPEAVVFPLRAIQDKLLSGFLRGEEEVRKVFSTTMSYAVALALYEGFERIELYGIELAMAGEYAYQRESMAFWMGYANGRGVELWIPEECQLLLAPLYAYEEVRLGDGSIATPPKDE